jgi:hypothetical protein
MHHFQLSFREITSAWSRHGRVLLDVLEIPAKRSREICSTKFGFSNLVCPI